jgi:hypothetical protein
MTNDSLSTSNEDAEDIRTIEARKNGPTETFDEFLAGFKADKII